MVNTDFVARCMAGKALEDVAAKQNTLTTEQLAAVNSGITSTDVEQIETNKNNILSNLEYGVQNIFKLNEEIRYSNGVKFEINSDGTITLSNTATSDAVFTLSSSLSLSDDTYVLYGDGFISGVFMDTYESGYTNRRTFTTYAVANSNTKIWRIVVDSGTNVDGVTIRPMICLKSLYDANPTYQPYALSNAELTNNIMSVSSKLRYGQFRRDSTDGTSYTFSLQREDTSNRYHYGLMVIGNPSSLPSIYGIMVDVGTNPTVSLDKIGGVKEATLSASVAYDGLNVTLTITSTSTLYGGIRLIWLD